MPERFYVVEVEGWLEAGSMRRGDNLTASVLDRAYCHQEVASFRSEDSAWVGNTPQPTAARVTRAREAAKSRCRELNAKHGPIDF